MEKCGVKSSCPWVLRQWQLGVSWWCWSHGKSDPVPPSFSRVPALELFLEGWERGESLSFPDWRQIRMWSSDRFFFLIAWKGRKAQSGLGSASSHVQLVLTGKLCRAFGLRDAQLAWFCRRKMLLALTPSWSSPFNCHRAPRTWSRTVLLLCSGCT